jgi:glycosyltransferase involved in cell wall biosynthesis
MIDVSVVMNDAGFREKVHGARGFSNQTFPDDRYEIIYVDYYNKPHPNLAEYPKVKVMCLNESPPLKNAKVYNAGLLAARGELVIVPDADCIVMPNFIWELWKEHQKKEVLAMYCHRYNEVKPGTLKNLSLEELERVCVKSNKLNFGACLSIRKKWLMAIGGWDEMEEQWTDIHCINRDLAIRIGSYGIPIEWNSNLKLYHPWHPQTGMGASPQQRKIVNTRLANKHWQSTQLERGEWPIPAKTLEEYLAESEQCLPY